MCAIHGKGFCTSARDAFNLLMRNFLRVIALDQVTEFLFFLTKVLVTMGMGAVTYIYFSNDKIEHHLHYAEVPTVIVMLGTYLIASVFFGVYSMAVDTLFLCFCKYLFWWSGIGFRILNLSSSLDLELQIMDFNLRIEDFSFRITSKFKY